VFLNVAGYGHVNPTLAVAQELVRRGERVIYYLSGDFRAAIEATGRPLAAMSRETGEKGDPPCRYTMFSSLARAMAFVRLSTWSLP
jgi:UDP:flavonoid glycosyltransferase YjiC (YdhE family)